MFTEYNTPINATVVLDTANGTFPANEWHKITVIKLQDQDGYIIYKNGELLALGGTGQYIYEHIFTGGGMDIGDVRSATWSQVMANAKFKFSPGAKSKGPDAIA